MKLTKRMNIYRVLVVIGFLLAILMCLTILAHMFAPDDWVYYYAAKNFSQSKLVIDDFLHFRETFQDEITDQGLTVMTGYGIKKTLKADNIILALPLAPSTR